MARIVLSLTVELELALDAVDELVRIFERLRFRHGRRFRDLERRIEKLAGGTSIGSIDFHALDGGRFVAGVPAGLAELIAEAKRLGV